MNNKDPYEKEKQQLDEALNIVGDKLRKQSEEYSKFKVGKYFHHESYCRKCNNPFNQQREIDEINSRMVELKHKQASLIAAINYCLTEYPSDRSSSYLAPIMENLFSK